MHNKEIKEALDELNTNAGGLSQGEAEKRLAEQGLNEIIECKKISPWEIFLNQFRSIVIWILIIATVISAYLTEYIDAITISVIIILIAVLGFFEEYKAERAIDALKKLASLKATVIRGGQAEDIDAKNLVRGDIILLETGDKIPADSRLIEAFNLQTQEAALTGESQPVKKNTLKVEDAAPLAERRNIAFSGTIVVSGRAKAVVAATGMNTELGKIAKMIQEVEQELTPLQKKMDQLGTWLGKVTIAIAALVFILGVLHEVSFFSRLLGGDSLSSIFDSMMALDRSFFPKILLVAVSLAVAGIPEGLPAVVAISLAIGTQRMLKRNALVRRLPSVETLGSTTVICTDKTGTLTANEMTVKKLYANGKVFEVTGAGYGTNGKFLLSGKPAETEEFRQLLIAGAVNNNAQLKDGNIIGDPTEGSLIVSAAKAGLKKEELDSKYTRTDEIEFTSERKLMSTIHTDGSGKIVYVKGAVEILVMSCNYIQAGSSVKNMSGVDRKNIIEVSNKFAGEALRVLGFAYKKLDKSDPEKNLIFLGLQGMMDPPRQEIRGAIEKCAKAGIRIVMITGDNDITAKAIAKDIGLSGKSITGQELEKIASMDEIVGEVNIFARVDPQHKIRIVEALQKRGHVVAMTGDGVNDAPALKKADIGIAMGISGTDVSKEASAMILTDDNFASIVNAVEEGRGVYDNIRKYLAYLLSGNIAEVLIILLAILFGFDLPLTATQILLINLVTDGLPAIALSGDPFEPNAMDRKPRKQDEPIYKGLNPYLIYYPICLTITALSIFIWFHTHGYSLLVAQTATFVTISMFELYQSLSCRSTIYPAFKVGIFKNKWLILAILSSFIFMAAAVFIPAFGSIIDIAPLSIYQFIFIIAVSSIGAVVIETSKYLRVKNESPRGINF